MNRRLAAIAVADVVGYSRLMESDEAGTLAALKERRKIILEPVVKEHGGRIVKLMGDGVLIEFASAVKAVEAGLSLQRKMAEANGPLPEDRRIVLRVGVNLGDVIGEGSDIYGEGVNIAARLEALAEPGGLCVSAKVHAEVQSRIDVAFEDLGEQQLKNIAAPVRVYRIRATDSGSADTPDAADGRPSIAVLPFPNMSGDADQQYFSDGITEDIITELSRTRALFVIARNSSFQYRDKAADVRRVARDLGVRYVVEGSVRKMGSRIRITVQLIDAHSGNHLWSERYDRQIEKLFDVQDEVTQTIVANLTDRLEEAEIRVAGGKRTDSLPAYDCLLRGIALLRGYGPDNNRRSRESFEQALAIDPHYALAHAYLALALLVEHGYGSASEEIKRRALDEALTAVRLDPRDNRCHIFLGQVYRFRNDFDLAISHLERAMALNPNDANGIAHLGGVLGIAGRADEAIEMIRRAMHLNPLHPDWYWGGLAYSLYAAGRHAEALAANQKIGASKSAWQLARDAACLAQLGRMEEAREVVREVLRKKPVFSVQKELPRYKYEADSQRLRDGLLRAGLPE